jgi:hypothetical protein
MIIQGFWYKSELQYNCTTYHPQIDGRIESVNQMIEDMLRMYVMDMPSKWKDYLHLVEFTYNNGYQASLKTSPFEAWYGKKCNTLISWDNLVDKVVLGPELFREMVKIKQNLKAT